MCAPRNTKNLPRAEIHKEKVNQAPSSTITIKDALPFCYRKLLKCVTKWEKNIVGGLHVPFKAPLIPNSHCQEFVISTHWYPIQAIVRTHEAAWLPILHTAFEWRIVRVFQILLCHLSMQKNTAVNFSVLIENAASLIFVALCTHILV